MNRLRFSLVLAAIVLGFAGCRSTVPPGQPGQARGTSAAPRVAAVLFVNASLSAPSLTTARALVVTELRRQLTGAGVQVQDVALAANEPEPKAVVDRAIRSFKPSHLMQLTLINGAAASGPQGPRSGSIQADLVDAGSRLAVWKHVVPLSTAARTTPAEVAAAIVERMRRDGLI